MVKAWSSRDHNFLHDLLVNLFFNFNFNFSDLYCILLFLFLSFSSTTMSEATSSPSGAISSSSSSLSSPNSAPISEPTSDEQPDLGAFVTVLREFNHLQPPPRIPVQIRTATSSTTPTFHSVSGAELRSRSGRTGNSRIGSQGAESTLSSFTRPPSSSFHPDGSTVWTHALIASYLNNGTPSNDVITDDEEYEGMGGEYQYTPASIALTVDIASEVDFPSFDERSQDSNPPFVEMSPYPQSDSVIPLPVILESNTQRLDSRETDFEDDLERSIDRDHGDSSSATSRDIIRPFLEDPVSATITTNSQNHSHSESHLTSIQLQSQARPNTTTVASPSSSLSYPTLPSSGVAPYISSGSVPQQPSSPENNPRNIAITGNSPTYLASLLNRSQNPIPPRTTSDSSLTTTGSASSSSLSLLSYQIIETPPLPVEEESDPETSTRPSLPRQPMPATTSTNTMASLSTASLSASLKTQRSVPSHSDSSSASTHSFATQRQHPLHQVFNESSGAVSQTSLPASVSTLPNPHSPAPSPEPELPRLEVGFNSHSSFREGWSTGRITARDIGIVNDLGTPDLLPLGVLPLDPPRERTQDYRAVLDENVVDDSSPLRLLDSRTKVQTTQKLVYTSGAERHRCIVNYPDRIFDLQTVLEHQLVELPHHVRKRHLKNEILCSSLRTKTTKRMKIIHTDIHILIRIPLDITDKLKRPGVRPRLLSHDLKRRLCPILKPILLLLYINQRHLIIKVYHNFNRKIYKRSSLYHKKLKIKFNRCHHNHNQNHDYNHNYRRLLYKFKLHELLYNHPLL